MRGCREVVLGVVGSTLLLAGGCVTPQGTGSSLSPGEPVFQEAGPLQVHVQYAMPVSPRPNHATLEVYICNRSNRTVRLTSARLDGVELPFATPGDPFKMPAVCMDGIIVKIEPPKGEALARLHWWNFLPSNEIEAGGRALLQINYRKLPAAEGRLELSDAEGQEWSFKLPRFRAPATRLETVTFSIDGREVYAQYTAQAVPVSVRVGGVALPGWRLLESGQATVPSAVAIKLPSAVDDGDAVWLDVVFADGVRRMAYIRPQRGIVLDCRDPKMSSSARARNGLDRSLPVQWMPEDFTCSDARSGNRGGSGPTLVSSCAAAAIRQPDRPVGMTYCTALYGDIYDIYGHIADFVYAKPYQLGWGGDPARFMEEEEQSLERERDSARPRPFHYIPEPYANRGRHVEPQELEMTVWTALAQGAKGVRYHYWREGTANGFEKCPRSLPAILELNRLIRERQEILGPLMPVTAATKAYPGAPANAPTWYKVYTGWSGGNGLLVTVRNLDYHTDGNPDANGAEPRFRAKAHKSLTVEIACPPWFHGTGQAVDLATGASMLVKVNDGKAQFDLDRLETVRVIWLPTAGVEKPRKPWWLFGLW